MGKIIKILKIIPMFLFAILIAGCANTKEQKKSLQEMPGPKQIVTLHLPSVSLNRNVTVQLHRLPTRKEKAANIGDYRDDIVAAARKGKVKICIPYGAYDIFVETGNGNYGLLGVKINEDNKVVKFSMGDLLM